MGQTTYQSRSGTCRLAAFIAAAMLISIVIVPTRGGASSSARQVVADVDSGLQKVTTGTVRVIVQGVGDAVGAVRRAVVRHGGTSVEPLPIIDGVVATVPAASVPELAKTPGVRAISLSRSMRVQGGVDAGAGVSVYPDVVGASDTWAGGNTGTGATVALIDTGVADVPDLAGRVLPVTDDVRHTTSACVDLSAEPDCGDSYGHGTFIAGLIAGNGAASNGAYKGVAPGAKIVSIKIAGRDGSADVSAVIAGIQWAVSFKDRYGIRVLNLSLGTDSTQSYKTDPLNYAVERAWAAGIAVVVAASNRGPSAGTIAKPGDDPFVVTVGAVDDRGTTSLGDDALPDFSSRGPTAADGLAKPDLAAPGAHLVSLRAPGSAIDTQFPPAVDTPYRRGSGTSMATGVVSGSVALLLTAHPDWSPDRVKFALTSTAAPDASSDPMAVGAGIVDASAALAAGPGLANAGLTRSNGAGNLDLSRGSVRIQLDGSSGSTGSVPNAPMGGSIQSTLSRPWTGSSWYGSSWYGSSWYGGTWTGSSWYGSSWYGSSWYGSSWYGSSWYGSSWYGSSWYGSSWYGSSWYGVWD